MSRHPKTLYLLSLKAVCSTVVGGVPLSVEGLPETVKSDIIGGVQLWSSILRRWSWTLQAFKALEDAGFFLGAECWVVRTVRRGLRAFVFENWNLASSSSATPRRSESDLSHLLGGFGDVRLKCYL
jgi:hypothetical protein